MPLFAETSSWLRGTGGTLEINRVPTVDGLHDGLGDFGVVKSAAGGHGLRPAVEGGADGAHEHEEEGPDDEEPGDAPHRVADEGPAPSGGGGHRRGVKIFVRNLIDLVPMFKNFLRP